MNTCTTQQILKNNVCNNYNILILKNNKKKLNLYFKNNIFIKQVCVSGSENIYEYTYVQLMQ